VRVGESGKWEREEGVCVREREEVGREKGGKKR
jgi:hypothetical protein